MMKSILLISQKRLLSLMRFSVVTILSLALTMPLHAQQSYKQLRQNSGNEFVDEYGRMMNQITANATEGISQKVQDGRGSWEGIGPFGGDVMDIAICPDNASIVFAAAGAPFISFDGGANWSVLNSLATISSSVDEFCAFPGGKILAGGVALAGKFAASYDYGQTWNTMNLPPNSAGQPAYIMDIKYNPSNPDVILFGASVPFGSIKSEVIYKSTDGGLSWDILNTDALDPALPVVDLSIDPTNTNTIYAVASGGLGGSAVLVSTDGGASWVNRSAGLNTTWVMNAVSAHNGVAYVAGGQLFGSQNFGIYKTSNAGQNWTNISSSFPVKAVNEIVISPANADHLFAGTEGDGVYKSLDAGVTWSYSTTGADNFACRRLVFNPDNAQELLGGFLSMAVFVSADYGSSWQSSTTGIGAMILNDIDFNPLNTQQIIVAFEAQNSGGCYFTNDGGSSWILAAGLPATRYSAVAIDPDGIMYAWSNGPSTVAQEGLYKSTDGGTTWINKGPNIGPVFETEIWDVEICEANPDLIIIAGNNFGNNGWKGVLYQSVNAGDSWVNVYISQLDNDSFQQACIPSTLTNTIAYAALTSQDGTGGFVKSMDGGNNWFDINEGLPAGLKRATWIVTERNNPDVVFGLAGSYETYFTAYKSFDGGGTWTDLNLRTATWEPLFCLAVHPDNDNVIYVGGSTAAKAVYYTVTGGESWQYAMNNFPVTYPTSFTEIFQKNGSYYFCASTYSASAHILEVMSPEYIDINGQITNFTLGTPVSGALVTFDGEMADFQVTSNTQGTFEITGFVAGTYTVEVQANAYNLYHADNVEITEPMTLEIGLTAPVIQADITSINGGVAPDSYNSSSFYISNSGSGPLEWHTAINFESEYGGVILQMDNLYSQVLAGCGFFGCEFDGENLWVVCTGATAGLNHYLCKFDREGNLLETYDQNIDVWGLRGIYYHTDGYLYGGSNVGFHRINPADGSITLLFEDRFGLACIRGLTYVPMLGGFVARDYDTDFVIFDVDGNFLGSLPKPVGLSTTVADIDYDPIHDCLWLYDRSGSASTTFYQYSICDGQLTGVVIDVPLFGGLTTQKAGGSFFSSTLVLGKYVLGAVTNSATPSDVLFAVDICPSWMKTTPNYGFLNPGENIEVQAQFNGMGLQSGTILNSTLHLNSCDPDVGTLEIPVTLQVETGIGINENALPVGKVSPNPFSKQANISFVLQNNSRVSLTIFNINRKVVSHLFNGEGFEGDNHIVWNGSDDSGNPVPAGVYTLMLKTNGSLSHTKLIRIL